MTRVLSTFCGSAAAGGLGFQANIGAIAGIHTLRGTPVQWTDGLAGAAPCAVSFETSGPGDDLSLELADGSIVRMAAAIPLHAVGDKLVRVGRGGLRSRSLKYLSTKCSPEMTKNHQLQDLQYSGRLDVRMSAKVRRNSNPSERGVLGAMHNARKRSKASHDTGNVFGFRPRGLTDDGALDFPDLLDLALAEK